MEIEQNAEFKSGDTIDLVITITEIEPAALAGATIRWWLGRNERAAPTLKKITGSQIVVDSDAMTASVKLLPADTRALSGRFYHEAELTDVLGNVSTITCGWLTISPDLVRPEDE